MIEQKRSSKVFSKIGCPVDQYDNWFVHLLVRKLDPNTRESWAIHEEENKAFSTYDDLLKFLENRVNSLTVLLSCYSKPDDPPPHKQNTKNQPGSASNRVSAHLAQSEKNTTEPTGKSKNVTLQSCLFCLGKHCLYNCPGFLMLGSDDRIKFIQAKNR